MQAPEQATRPRPPDDPAAARPGARPRIVFVGGTGRSGTHVLASLISRHRRFAYVPVESRFHVNPKGLAPLLRGEVDADEFLRKLKRFWWYRIPAGAPLPAVLPRLRLGRPTRGLHSAVDRADFDAAVERFRARLGEEPPEACGRGLFLDLLWPIAERAGKPGLVEMSTHNVTAAPELARMFPDSRLIHIVRDGRDAGSSKVSKRQRRHHPRTVAEGIPWWLERLERAERAIAAAPPGYVLHLSLDQLVAGDREAEFSRLVEFLGLANPGRMRRFFDRAMTPDNASRGRWRTGLADGERQAVNEAYERAIERLEAHGYPSGPLLRRALERLG